MILAAAVAVEALGRFDAELRPVNWLIQIVWSAAFATLGVWLRSRQRRHRRHRATGG